MTSRVLEFEEWARLPEYMDPVLMTCRPGTSRMCVVENDEGEIVARWLLYPVLFAEDAWIDPRYRKRVGVTRRLWRLVQSAARDLGFGHMVSTAITDDAQRLLQHPSIQSEVMPGPMMVYPVKEVSNACASK